MADATLWSNWTMALILVSIVVVAAAVLLLLVWWTAQRILKGAVQALDLVKQIKANSAIIWALDSTNQSAANILADAQSIRNSGAALAQALHAVDEQRPK
jgi:ABC-type multidrug transport system fused ATPase/permease subunit